MSFSTDTGFFIKELVASFPFPAIVYKENLPVWSNCFAQEDSFIPTNPVITMEINEFTIALFVSSQCPPEKNVVTFYPHSLDRSVS